jgi:hypothetical protein
MFDIDKNQQIDKKEMEKIIDAIYDLVRGLSFKKYL